MRQFDVLYTGSTDDYSIIFKDVDDIWWTTWMKGIKSEMVARTTAEALTKAAAS